MVDEPGTNDTPTTDQPGINDTPTTDEPGNNDTLTVDEPGTNDTPTVNEKEFIIVNTKEKKIRTYLNEENEPVTKKRRMFTGLIHSMLVATLSNVQEMFPCNFRNK
jgi:hypothetical protein